VEHRKELPLLENNTDRILPALLDKNIVVVLKRKGFIEQDSA
jgi:hypothetical protein